VSPSTTIAPPSPRPEVVGARPARERRDPARRGPARAGPRRPAPSRREVSRRDRQDVFGRRVRFVRLALALVLLLIVCRLVDVQVLRSGQYQRAASLEFTQTVAIPALRGGIYDRNGSVLAMSLPTETVVADDFQVLHPRSEAAALGPMLGLSVPRLAALLHEHSGYVPIARNVSETRAGKVSGLDFPGITLIGASERVDPNGNLALPVLGTLHASGSGASGLEYEYNAQLAGRAGSESLLESPSGVLLPGTRDAQQAAARPGTGLELTLDEPLQYTAEQALASEILSSHALSGVAVVMDVRTGDILAMANLVRNQAVPAPPSGGAAAPATTSGSGLSGTTLDIGSSGPVSQASSNLAVTQVYEPGSVFKIVPFSAALQDGVITPGTTFMVPDQIVYDGSVFHDATPHPTLPLTATQILAQSSNVGTAKITMELGEHRLLAQVGKLGFGQPTGLGFPGGEAGIIAGATQWEPTNYVSLPIGQVDAVTPLQVLDAFNAVADGGTLVRPRLVRATVGTGGKVVAAAPSSSHRVMPTWVATDLRKMFEQVVDVGTGTNAVVPGYIVAGKTGTSQIPMSGQAGYIPGAFMATFVGFAPARHPVLSAIVVLDRPTPIYGGAVAAPVFSQIMGYALHRYDIPTTPGAPGPGQPQVTGSPSPGTPGAG